MVGWHRQFNGQELGQTLGDDEGQGSLACCSPWGHEESHTTGLLNNNNKQAYQDSEAKWDTWPKIKELESP